jgi:hypothetical protein
MATMSHTAFFAKARQSKSNYACEKEWARHFARAYYHEIDATRGFLPIYNQLLSETSMRTRASVKNAKSEQTDAEYKRGKHELNRILHKEYNNWYDAFEDSEGWCRHAAKKLSRKTGIEIDALVPVVQAWLLEKS